MSIVFIDRTNRWIDELVELAYDQQNDHFLESLFVPPHDIHPEDLIDDTLTEDEIGPQIIDFSKTGKAEAFAGIAPQPFPPAVIAVDSGVIDLGELTSGGTVFAIRGAAICYPPKNEQPFVCLYNTGALLIDHQNKFPIFHYIGTRLGKEDLFVKLSDIPPHYRSKQAMGDTPNQIQDRCRNFVERMIQEEAIAILESYGGGILLIDGALSGGTFDTPETYMRGLLSKCSNSRVSIAAISKKTRITVGGRPISSLFSDQQEFIGYAPIASLLEEERQAHSEDDKSGRAVQAVSLADDIYAVRFTYPPLG